MNCRCDPLAPTQMQLLQKYIQGWTPFTSNWWGPLCAYNFKIQIQTKLWDSLIALGSTRLIVSLSFNLYRYLNINSGQINSSKGKRYLRTSNNIYNNCVDFDITYIYIFFFYLDILINYKLVLKWCFEIPIDTRIYLEYFK